VPGRHPGQAGALDDQRGCLRNGPLRLVLSERRLTTVRTLRRVGRVSRVLCCGLVGLGLAGVGGCSASGNFEDQIRQLLGITPGTVNTTTLNIRIVNEAGTNINVALTLSIDGEEQTFTCTATQHVCETPLATCPESVKTISERLTDTSGYFRGGRNFNGTDESFNFDSGEFECGQILFYRFTETTAEAFVF